MEFKEDGYDTEDLCLVQFAKMMETSYKCPTEDEQLPLDMDQLDIDEDDLKFHFILRAGQGKTKLPLPDYMKLLPKYPGENK
jgi:hypothetical protein